MLADCNLTFEEFYSVLVQIEAILNSRPLTPLTCDPNDVLPLTPAHFLIGRPLLTTPEPNLIELPESKVTRYQKLQQIHQQFWHRWSREYLLELQRRSKWCQQQRNIQPGTMVLLHDDNAPPLQWKLGRVEEVIFGSDNVVRVVNVRTNSGIIKRPVVKVCPLPLENS